MRILVLSDSHGDRFAVGEAVSKHRSADIMIHLGDGGDDMYEIRKLYPEKIIHQVRGNCDFGSRLPVEGFDIAEGKRVFFAHGHTYSVKFGLNGFMSAARDRKADIALFGHTHNAEIIYENGVYFMNPGSVSYSRGRTTYGLIDITPAGVVCNIIKVD